MTRTGAPRVEELADLESAELLTGVGWALARIRPTKDIHLMRVHLSDGSVLLCAAGTTWPVVPPSPDGKYSDDSLGSPLSNSSVKKTQDSPGRQDPPRLGEPASREGAESPATKSIIIAKPACPTGTPPRQSHACRDQLASSEPTKTGQVATSITKSRAASAPLSPEEAKASATTSVLVRSKSTPKRHLRVKWVPKATADLKQGDRIAPYPRIQEADLQSSIMSIDAALEMGAKLGQKTARIGTSRSGLDDTIVGDGVRGCSPEAIRAFVEGWSSSQQGCLVGCPDVMADLQILLRRVGISKTLIETATHRVVLCVDEREAWPSQTRAARAWTRRLRTTHQTVVEVETTGKKGKAYTISVLAGVATVVAASNTVVAADVTDVRRGAPTSSATDVRQGMPTNAIAGEGAREDAADPAGTQ